MSLFPDEFCYQGIPLGLRIRRKIGNTSIFRVRQGVQEKMAYYTPTNPQTVEQQAWRAVFTGGVAAALALTPEQKQVYRLKAKTKPGQTWFTVFMSEYLWSESH